MPMCPLTSDYFFANGRVAAYLLLSFKKASSYPLSVYYSIAFSILPGLAGGLAQELLSLLYLQKKSAPTAH